MVRQNIDRIPTTSTYMSDIKACDNNRTGTQAPPFVITVGRQFGSGGRELARALADELDIAYYDKELLAESAKLSGIEPEFFEQKDERFPSFLHGIFSFTMGVTPMCYYTGGGSITDDSLYKAVSDFITSEAEKRSFVVVGRTADYILRNHPRVVNIFLHAPMEECVKRITSRADALTPKRLRRWQNALTDGERTTITSSPTRNGETHQATTLLSTHPSCHLIRSWS